MDTMTVLSKEMYEQVHQLNTVAEAVELLLRYGHFRTLGDILTKFHDGSDIRKILSAGLQLWFPESKPDANDRKIRNWLGGKTQSVSKEDAFVISRILELTLDQTDDFLKYACGEGIHWRNPEDIVWCYAIVHGLDPDQTEQLRQRANAAVASSGKGASDADSYTAEVRDAIVPSLHQGEDALLAFLKNEHTRLGTLHNTAYLLFTQYMDLLKRGWSECGMEFLFDDMTRQEKKKAADAADGDIGPHKSESLTVRDILETYLYRKCVPVQARGKAQTPEVFSAIQKSVRQNWPDEAALSRMEARKLDVSRKALILLFLATDGTDSEYEEYDSPESPDDVFDSLYTRMNTMLTECGFPQLDPRNPFDWIILFCIACGDFWEIDGRLESILTQMYPSGV